MEDKDKQDKPMSWMLIVGLVIFSIFISGFFIFAQQNYFGGALFILLPAIALLSRLK